MLSGVEFELRSRAELNKGLALFVVLWTLVVAIAASHQVYNARDLTLEMARFQARESINKDIVYRSWNALHGGVYVAVSEHAQPNPRLDFLPERDLTTNDGRVLTLINPAYMTRQVHELARARYGLEGHITSLRPVRPENRADPWESKALKAFEAGAQEVNELVEYKQAPYLRLMHPLVTTEACMTCHETQGYQVGEIRGGISVSVPMAPFLELMREQRFQIIKTYGLIWFIIVIGGWLIYRHLVKRNLEREHIDQQLMRSEKRFRDLIESISDGIWESDTAGRFTYVSPAMQALTGYELAQLMGAERNMLMEDADARRSRCCIEAVSGFGSKANCSRYAMTRAN
jgi:PAS domain-containing protein